MKKLLFILFLTANTISFGMQHAPKGDEWPVELPDSWQFCRKLSKQFNVQHVILEIQQAYPNSRIDCDGKYREVDIEDSKQNIIQKFHGKPWFSVRKLVRPPLLREALKD